MSIRKYVVTLAAAAAVASPSLASADPAPVRGASIGPRTTSLDIRSLFGRGGPLSPGQPTERGESSAAPLKTDRDDHPVVSILANPALAPVGKWSARLEVAPLAAHAFFVEGSRLDIDVPTASQHVTGYSVDVGYHLFFLGHGVDGPYVGPRAFYGSGGTELANARVSGWGADVGWQVVLGNFALNLGAGAARADAIVEPRPGVVPEQYESVVPKRVEGRAWIPLATAGLGLAF